MREHLTPANMVTSVSLTIGFLALLLAPRSVALVTVIVLLAAILDGIDGTLARRRGGDRTFGAQLDSMADLLCFCVVPAFAMHHAWPGGAWVPAVLAGCGFVLAGAWRLARFPLVQQQDRFVGLPTPAAGTLLMLLVLWAPAVVAMLGAMLLSVLMVSTLPFPTLPTAAAAVGPKRRARRRKRFPYPGRLVVRQPLPARRGSDDSAPRGVERRRRAADRAGRVVHAIRKQAARRKPA